MHAKSLIFAGLQLPLLSAGWTLQLGQNVWNGRLNKGCTTTNHRTGEKLSWSRGFFEDCCIHLYRNNRCTDPQAGISCPSWNKNLGQDIRSFKVTNCILGFREKRAVETDAEKV
jgi:hypothetical protein